MKALLLIFLSLLILSFNIYPQAPDTLWTRTYGLIDCDQWAVELQKTFNNGYIIFGERGCSPSANDSILLIKTDNIGNLQWMSTYGGVQYTGVHSGKQTSDSGYIVTGNNYYGGSDNNIYLLKINNNGDSTWFQHYESDTVEAAYSVQQAIDGGYILTGIFFPGEPNQDIYVVKADSLGNVEWLKNYDIIGVDFGYSIEMTSDSGYIITGKMDQEICLMKINSLGDMLFIKTYMNGEGYQVKQTFEMGYVIAGHTSFNEIVLIKADQNGDTLWTALWDESTAYSAGHSVYQTSDSGYIVVGYGYFGLGGFDIFIAKVNKNGEKLWKKIMGGPYDDWGYSVLQNEDDSYMILGTTSYAIIPDWYVWLIKLKPDTGIVTTNYNIVPLDYFNLSQNYPNPFNPSTTIKYQIPELSFVTLKVYDVLGKEVTTLLNEEKPAGEYNVEFRIDNLQLTSGIYFYKLSAGNFVETKKMVLLK